MTEFTIKTAARAVTFFHTADDTEGKTGYLWADTNGKKGTLGEQCMKFKDGVGIAIEVTEGNARRKAREWLKAQAEEDSDF